MRHSGLIILLLMIVMPVSAQQPIEGYMLAPGSDGITQVWQLVDDSAQPITAASADVRGYAVASDGQLIVYSSGGQLWLQRHDGATLPLATLSDDIPANPVLSASGQQIAYEDNGIWLAWVSGGTPQQLSTDPTMHMPHFVPGTRQVLVTWGQTVALLNADTGEVLVGDRPGYNRALPLSDGRTVLYSPTAPGVLITADGDLSTLTELLPNGPAVRHMVELNNGGLRLVVWQASGQQTIVDLDLNTGITTTVSFEDLSFVGFPRLSPDGRFLAGYMNVTPGASGVDLAPTGQLVMYEISTGAVTTLEYPAVVSAYHWAR